MTEAGNPKTKKSGRTGDQEKRMLGMKDLDKADKGALKNMVLALQKTVVVLENMVDQYVLAEKHSQEEKDQSPIRINVKADSLDRTFLTTRGDFGLDRSDGGVHLRVGKQDIVVMGQCVISIESVT